MKTHTEELKDKITGTTTPTKAPLTLKSQKTEDIKNIFNAYRGLISQIIPKTLTAERVINIAATTINRKPAIAECSTVSILGGVVQASMLGFELIPSLGQAYLVPFDNSKTGVKEAVFMLGYRGMMDLAIRTGLVETIYAKEVCENDFFEYEEGLNRKLVHRPADNNRGKFIKAYAVVKYLKGGYNFVVMSKEKIEAVRARSKAGKSKYSPWANGLDEDYIEMALKTCVRKLFKYMPTSIEYRTASVDESALDVREFIPDSSGMYNFDSLNAEEAPVEEIPTDDTKAEEAPAPQEIPETPKKGKVKEKSEVPPEGKKVTEEEMPVEPEFSKEVRKTLMKQLQTEIRKTENAKNEFIRICKEEKVNGLVELGDRNTIEKLTEFLQRLQLTNDQEGDVPME